MFLAILGVEYFLWLNSTGRFVLLAVLVLGTLFLLYKYIITPLFYLFRIKKGISNKHASILIGKHFPEVGDKLLNLLDLAEDKNQSELLMASIAQRSKSMQPIPFVKAINFKDNLKYVKYFALPVLLVGVLWLSGNLSSFFGSYERMVNYDTAYEPPAPFAFFLNTNDLKILEGENLSVQVSTQGKYRPENVFIVLDNKEFLLQENDGFFEYTFNRPSQNTEFYFKANDVESRTYAIEVLKIPLITDFKMVLDYPNYIKRQTETVKSTGNATFPEGTKVTWMINGQHTDTVALVLRDTVELFKRESENFLQSKRVYSNLDYEISTSNANVSQYEKLAYKFTVIKDANPLIDVKEVKDSINPNVVYYVGNASDDYELRNIRLVCYPSDNMSAKQIIGLSKPNSNVAQFYYTFPSGLQINPDQPYSYYFEAIDNDALHGGKSVRSQVFNTILLNDNQLKNNDLKQQQSLIDQFDKSLDKLKDQRQDLKELNDRQKEKNRLDFSEKNQIRDFLQKQQQQESMMEKFSKQLKDNLKKSETDSKENKLLQERLERQEMKAKKNQELLEELNKIAEKINKQELAKRLEELAKSQQNSERNLEQILELTKQYYVKEKAAQMAEKLKALALQQELLSKLKLGEEFGNDQQEKLNDKFKEIAKELDVLDKDNKDLKKPMELGIDKSKQEDVKKDQKDALEEINKHQGSEESSQSQNKQKAARSASQKQKSAADKMQQMGEKMQQSSAGGSGGDSMAESAEMLRQILDNLVTFSFKQENLYDELNRNMDGQLQFSSSIKRQKELRGLFEHVDDSLFALSLRQAEIAEFVNEQVTEAYYNIDKSLEQMAENRMYQAVSDQKYVLNASNSLADFLANVLDNMQQSMKMGQGKGQGQGFQLPDIIQSQQQVQQKMGEKGQQGKQGKNGEEGQDGQQGQNGKNGEKGQQNGKEGQQGSNGNQGGNGSKGNGSQEGKKEQGSNGNENGGEGSGNGQQSEEELKEIYEIYKSQQIIRNEFEKQLKNMMASKDKELAKKLLRQMEDFENDLLENGITQRTKDKVNNIHHELMKLENAEMKQGEKKEREAITNKNLFKNPITTKPDALDKYRNEIEILNRQALPLHQIFKNKIQRYFKTND